jgi:hypothetical protein
MSIYHHPRIVTDGLVLHLDAGNRKSYPGAGTSWYDLGKHKNNLTFNSSSFTYASGYISTTKTGAYPSIASNSSISLSNEITIEAIIRPTNLNSTWNIIASKWFGGTSSEWHWSLKSSGGYKQNLYTTGASDKYGTKVFSNNVWYVTGFTLSSAGLLTFYTNGIIETTHSSITMSSSNAYFCLSDARASIYGFNGDYGTFKMYNRCLSQSEILQNFYATRERFGL